LDADIRDNYAFIAVIRVGKQAINCFAAFRPTSQSYNQQPNQIDGLPF
jgi:hypothetical protein